MGSPSALLVHAAEVSIKIYSFFLSDHQVDSREAKHRCNRRPYYRPRLVTATEICLQYWVEILITILIQPVIIETPRPDHRELRTDSLDVISPPLGNVRSNGHDFGAAMAVLDFMMTAKIIATRTA